MGEKNGPQIWVSSLGKCLRISHIDLKMLNEEEILK